MGQRLLRIAPELIIGLCIDGRTIGGDAQYHVVEGVPEGTRFVRAWYEGEEHASGYIAVLLEHESWPETPNGERFPSVVPIFETVKISS